LGRCVSPGIGADAVAVAGQLGQAVSASQVVTGPRRRPDCGPCARTVAD